MIVPATDMLTIYVGESKDVVNRIRSDHCSGNVEGSALRKYIAIEKGYTLNKTKRQRGCTRIRLNLPDLGIGEQAISDYLRSGIWKLVFCSTKEEARDFQFYVIEKLRPLLNKNLRNWNGQQHARYAKLLTELTNSIGYRYSELPGQTKSPGVYVLYHNKMP